MYQALQLVLFWFVSRFSFPAHAWGNCYLMGPTYGTIDNKYWSFNQGQCAPLVAKPCNPAQMVAAGGPKDFELSVDSYFTYDEYYGGNVLFSSYGRQYTIRNLLFVAYGKKILIGWDQAKVNGKIVTLPWYYPNKQSPKIWISGSNSAAANYLSGKTLGTNFGLGIYIYGCPVAFLRGITEKGLKNNLCGICGTWNGNRNDDFTLPNGTITASGGEMIKEWTSKGKQSAKCNKDIKVKNCPPGQKKQAEKICQVLLDRSGPLKPCYSPSWMSSWYPRYVKMHYDRCIELACQNRGRELKKVACSKINEMTSICQVWNNNRDPIEPINGCAPKCKANSKPACISQACRNSCEDPAASASYACRLNFMPCVPGCECDDGYTYSGKRDACVKRC